MQCKCQKFVVTQQSTENALSTRGEREEDCMKNHVKQVILKE